jgi:hypothetical protein
MQKKFADRATAADLQQRPRLDLTNKEHLALRGRAFAFVDIVGRDVGDYGELLTKLLVETYEAGRAAVVAANIAQTSSTAARDLDQ